MKTLVIHPKDTTTDFLSVIYSNKDWTVINDNPSRKYLKDQIKSHDRIVMLGHGTKDGLLGFNRFVINPALVYLLRDKIGVYIWCNADVFVKRFSLKGFYTGMIISDYDEALMFCLYPTNNDDIKLSNTLFAESIKNSIDSDNMILGVKDSYIGSNPVIDFNKNNIYST